MQEELGKSKPPYRRTNLPKERTTVLLTNAADGRNERVEAPRRRREAQEREALVLRFKQKCAAQVLVRYSQAGPFCRQASEACGTVMAEVAVRYIDMSKETDNRRIGSSREAANLLVILFSVCKTFDLRCHQEMVNLSLLHRLNIRYCYNSIHKVSHSVARSMHIATSRLPYNTEIARP